MIPQLRGTSILLLATMTIVTAACVMSYWSMMSARQDLAEFGADLAEARELSHEIRELTDGRQTAGFEMLPKDQLEETLRSVVQRIQPLPTTTVSVSSGNERRASAREFVMRQTEVQVTSLTLREVSQVLKSARASCPMAEIAEVAISAAAEPKQTDAERWALGFRLQEFRYSPAEKSR